MFGSHSSGVELSEREILSGESDDQTAYLVTLDEMTTGWAKESVESLPDLSQIPTGPYLAMLLEHFDRQKMSGHDLVELLKARERQVSHLQAGSMADSVEISYAAAPDGTERLDEPFEYAADEIRAALALTRRAAEYRLSAASDIRERLPQVWQLLDTGSIDVVRARVFADGTAHVPAETARLVVSQLADAAPKLTASQLRHRIRKLCMAADPEDANKREQTAHEQRKLVIEPTVDGTANLHLFDIALSDARAIGRRVNGHMISLKKEDRSGRTHDQLRADIARDLLLGGAHTNGGRGLVDIRVPVATVDGGDEPGEIPGAGLVTGPTARKIVAELPGAVHQITLVDEHGQPVRIVTLSRSATKKIRSHINTLQPTCSFPGCTAPAADCDFDHFTPWAEGGETSTTNGGPKCDHDHTLKDHGWKHSRICKQDRWTSPLGHSYTTVPP